MRSATRGAAARGRIPGHSGTFDTMGGDGVRRNLCAWVALVVLAACSATSFASLASAETGEVRVYRANHRVAEELVPIAEIVLGEEGRVSVDPARNALVLMGPGPLLDQTFALLREQDRAPVIVEIHYRAFDFAQWSKAGFSVVEEDAGNTSGGATGGFSVLRVRKTTVRGERHGSRRFDDFTSRVRVASGGEVEIARGASQPLISRDAFGAHVAGVAEGTRGIRARPRVLQDGRVHLELEYDDQVVQSDGRVEGTRGHTRVTLRPGELVAIGDLTTSGRTADRDGRVWSTRSDRDERIHLIEVRFAQ